MGQESGAYKRAQHKSQPTRHLVLGNCGGSPDIEVIRQLFQPFDPTADVTLPEGTRGALAFVTLATVEAAGAARAALSGTVCDALPGSGQLSLSYVERREGCCDAQQPAEAPVVAMRSAAECGIPGLACIPEFVSREEEAELLALAAAQTHWQVLARRRVMHFGYVFDYETRGVGQQEHPIPPQALCIAHRIQQLPGTVAIDQLTVNEYGCGVGISPHVETHSAFTGAIASLSLGGSAAMALRREGHAPRAIFLPPRSLLVLSGEARYAWQHYIPHRKTDLVAPAPGRGSTEPEVVPRGELRVSFTFRQVRSTPCDCSYPEHCDSQLAPLVPTRMALKRMAEPSAAAQEHQQAAVAAAAAAETALAAQAAAGTAAAADAGSEGGGRQATGNMQARTDPAAAGSEAAGQLASAEDGGDKQAPGVASLSSSSDVSLDAQLAALEARYVHDVYNAIAPHFASTRFAVWPRVRAFLEGLPPCPVVADVGCGNGKYFGVRRDAFVLGSDRSEGLVHVAARRLAPPPCGEGLRADVAVADGMALPYRPGSCDGVLCIAVLHHISSPTRRVALLSQLLRLLRPGGRALVTVWATEQENMRKVRSWQPLDVAGGDAGAGGAASAASAGGSGDAEPRLPAPSAPTPTPAAPAASAAAGSSADEVASGDYFVPWHLPFHRTEAAAAARKAGSNAGSTQQQQAPNSAAGAAAGSTPAAAASAAPRVDAGKGAVVYQRYYHLFGRGELDSLVAEMPGAAVVDSFYDKDNWCCVFERL